MEKYYRVPHAGDDSDNEDGKKGELVAVGIDKAVAKRNSLGFKYVKRGHKANACPENKESSVNNQRKRFNGIYHLCQKNGHRKADSWKNEENKSKRPKWFKSYAKYGKEVNTVITEGSVKVLMTMQEMCIPLTTSILQDLNMFIGDTGASTHSP